MSKLVMIVFTGLLLLTAACNSGGSVDTGKVIKSAPVGNNLTVTISNDDGVLRHGDEEFYLSFKDASGKFVDIGATSLNFYMPAMGTMPAMNNQATLTTTDTPGIYRAKSNIEHAGEWQAQITYEGAAGRGRTSIPATAQ